MCYKKKSKKYVCDNIHLLKVKFEEITYLLYVYTRETFCSDNKSNDLVLVILICSIQRVAVLSFETSVDTKWPLCTVLRFGMRLQQILRDARRNSYSLRLINAN